MPRTHLALMLIVAMFVGAASVGLLWAQTSEDETPIVRINARALSDGRTEFTLQQREDGAWGERILPNRRFFPASPPVGRWLNSSPISIATPVGQEGRSAGRSAFRNPYVNVYGETLEITTVSNDSLYSTFELRIRCEFGRLTASFAAVVPGAGYGEAALDRDRGYAIGLDGVEYTELDFTVGSRSVRHWDARPFVQRLSEAQWLTVVMYKQTGGYLRGVFHVENMFDVAGAGDILACD